NEPLIDEPLTHRALIDEPLIDESSRRRCPRTGEARGHRVASPDYLRVVAFGRSGVSPEDSPAGTSRAIGRRRLIATATATTITAATAMVTRSPVLLVVPVL